MPACNHGIASPLFGEPRVLVSSAATRHTLLFSGPSLPDTNARPFLVCPRATQKRLISRRNRKRRRRQRRRKRTSLRKRKHSSNSWPCSILQRRRRNPRRKNRSNATSTTSAWKRQRPPVSLRMHFSLYTVPTMISEVMKTVCAVLSVGENGSHAGNAMAASGVDGATALLQQLKTGADAADDKDANPERRRKAAFKAYEVGSIRLIANGHICAQAYARTHAHTLTHACRRRHTGTRDPADARRESRPEAFADQGAHLSGLAEVARKSNEPGIDAGRLSFRCGLLWGPSLGFNAVLAGIGLV